MTDHLTPELRSENMRRIKAKDTGPEMVVRQTAFSLGYRYKLHEKDLPGKPDLVFPGRRAVIFVHGCFWHAHDCGKGKRVPGTNNDYWVGKRERNKARDDAAHAALLALGWRVLTIWECETKDLELLTARIKEFLDPPESEAAANADKPAARTDAIDAGTDNAIETLRGALTTLAAACEMVRVTAETPDDVIVELLRSRLIKAGSVEAWCERIKDLGGPEIAPRRLKAYVMDHLVCRSTRIDSRVRDALVFEDWHESR